MQVTEKVAFVPVEEVSGPSIVVWKQNDLRYVSKLPNCWESD